MSGTSTHDLGRLEHEAEHAARYKALRAGALSHGVAVPRDGLVLLMHKGLRAWMSAWASLPAPPSPRGDPSHRPLSTPPSDEVIHVLAAMALEHIQEVQP